MEKESDGLLFLNQQYDFAKQCAIYNLLIINLFA
jgi:hypothetical protein